MNLFNKIDQSKTILTEFKKNHTKTLFMFNKTHITYIYLILNLLCNIGFVAI